LCYDDVAIEECKRKTSDMSFDSWRKIPVEERPRRLSDIGDFLFDSKRKLSDMSNQLLLPMSYPMIAPPPTIQSFSSNDSGFDAEQAIPFGDIIEAQRMHFMTANDLSFDSQDLSYREDEVKSHDLSRLSFLDRIKMLFE